MIGLTRPHKILISLILFVLVKSCLNRINSAPLCRFYSKNCKKQVIEKPRRIPFDGDWTRWKWRDSIPHETLLAGVAYSTKEERRIMQWMNVSRTATNPRSGIGLSYMDRDEREVWKSPPNRIPRGNEGPGHHNKLGSLDKYNDLLREWQIGGTELRRRVCDPEDRWQKQYKDLHSEVKRGVRPLRMLEYHCPTNEPCGGLADRLLGIISTFFYSVAHSRAVLIHFDSPIPFDTLFDSPNLIDWSYPYSAVDERRHPIFGDPQQIEQRVRYRSLQWVTWRIDQWFSSHDWNLETKWIRMLINRGLSIRSFSYPIIRDRLKELGFRQDTTFSCLTDYLIRPKREALDFISQYATLFALPTVFSVGIQIRAGDASMASAETDALNTELKFRRHFDCARQIVERYSTKGQRIIYYVISDSNHLIQDAIRTYPDRVVVSGLGIRHVDPQLHINSTDSSLTLADSMMNSVVEFYSLAATDYKVLTMDSGFGKIASFLRGKPDTTLIIRPWEDINCGLDSSLQSFTSLASEWSLG